MARLTKEVRQQFLNQNEGFTRRTYSENRNSRPEKNAFTRFQVASYSLEL